jgi:hypothetical protein
VCSLYRDYAGGDYEFGREKVNPGEFLLDEKDYARLVERILLEVLADC